MGLKIFASLLITVVLLFILISLFAVISATTINQAGGVVAIPQQVRDIFKNNTQDSDTFFGIVVWDLNTTEQYFFNENEQFEAASLYKLAVMYTLFYLETKGNLNTSQPDIQDNLEAMITLSSNKAAIYLVDTYTSWEEITELMLAKGLEQTDFTNDKLLTTPKDIAILLSLINDPDDISPEASGKMMKLLSGQTINDRIPAFLPEEITVYHKTGDEGDVSHDAGIVSGFRANYILVIMTKNSNDPEKIKPIMAKISLDVFNFLSIY